MKSKTLYLILLLMLAALPATAADAAAMAARAAQAYDKELYNEALKLYRQAEKEGGSSSMLCYNMGNTCYRLKDNAHAILYYERALLLDPSNGDARFNLEFVREKAQINDTSGDSFFSDWLGGLVSRLSSNTWATVAIVAFIAMLLLAAVYLFLDHVLLRKVGFFGAIAMLVVTLAANACAYHMHSKAVNRSDAIVTAERATLSTSPRTPKDKTEEAMTLGAGHKVQIVDSVNNAGTRWLDVRTPDGQRAWISAQDVEVI